MHPTVTIDAEFPSASAGEIREVAPARFEIDYKPEALPAWFQATLDRRWDGGGVPKEYMFHVRARNPAKTARTVSIRFLFSLAGCSYLDLPWWIRRDDTWRCLAENEAVLHDAGGYDDYIDITLSLAAGESAYIGSAPYESPDAIDAMTRCVVATCPGWTLHELGTSAQGRPILALESEPRPLKLLACGTMQGCEPTWMGLLHAGRTWTTPAPDRIRLCDRVQLCVVPLTNPDGLATGFSVTNAVGEVPKFSTHLASAGKPAPLETQAMWDYLDRLRPQARIEVHAHFTRPDFTRSIGMQEIESMPAGMRGTAMAIEQALDSQYHQPGSGDRRVRIDPRIEDQDVYGVREVAERFGVIELFLQATPDPLEAHNADIWNCITTVAGALTTSNLPHR